MQFQVNSFKLPTNFNANVIIMEHQCSTLLDNMEVMVPLSHLSKCRLLSRGVFIDTLQVPGIPVLHLIR